MDNLSRKPDPSFAKSSKLVLDKSPTRHFTALPDIKNATMETLNKWKGHNPKQPNLFCGSFQVFSVCFTYFGFHLGNSGTFWGKNKKEGTASLYAGLMKVYRGHSWVTRNMRSFFCGPPARRFPLLSMEQRLVFGFPAKKFGVPIFGSQGVTGTAPLVRWLLSENGSLPNIEGTKKICFS